MNSKILYKNLFFFLLIFLYSVFLSFNHGFIINNYDSGYSLSRIFFFGLIRYDYTSEDLIIFCFKFLLIFFPIIFMKKFNFNVFRFIIFSLYIFFFVPLISFFFPLNFDNLKNFIFVGTINEINFEEKKFYFSLLFLTLCFCVLFFIENLEIKIKTYKKEVSYKNFNRFILLINIICFIYFVFFIFQNFEKISVGHSLRSKLNGFYGYLINWFLIVFIPILFYLNQNFKFRLSIIFFVLAISILSQAKFYYLITIILILSSTNIFNKVLKNENFFFYFFSIILIYQLFIFTYEIIFYNLDIRNKDIFFWVRIFFEQPKNYLIFFDFFQKNDFLYLKNINIIQNLFLSEEISTNNNNNLYQQIRSIYGGGTPTPNLFTLEGYSNFGINGFFLITLILSVIGIFLKNYFDFTNQFLLIPLLIQSVYILDLSLFTVCLSHGLFISCLFSFLKLKK